MIPLLKGYRTLADFCRRTAYFLSGSNRVKICRDVGLPHTSRFFVATNRVSAWSRVNLRHVGKDSCSRDSHDHSSLVEERARPEIVLFHRTLADMARQDVLRSNTVRYRPTKPDFVADLSEFIAH